MSIQDYRNIEIQKLIEQAFAQFNIVDPAEKLDIASSIKSQLSANDALSKFTPSLKASSSKYRAEVRAVLIDIISQLLHAKDMDLKIKQLEGTSRQAVEEAHAKINNLEKTIIQNSDNIRESFEEQVDAGTHNNTMVKDGHLGVAKFGTLSKISDMSIIVSPAESIQDEVSVATSGDLEQLTKTGTGSDSYWIRVTSPAIPEFFENNRLMKGALVSLEFTAASEGTLPIMLSIKGSGFFRIFSLEGYNDQETDWDNLGSDSTYGEHSFVEIDTETNYTYYRVKLHIPSADTENDLYFYNLGLHNIKIFNKAEDTTNIFGEFKSYPYLSDKALFKAKFDAAFDGFCNFKINFEGRTDINPIEVLPRDSKYAKIFRFYEGDEPSLTLPFAIKSGESVTVTDQYNTSYPVEPSDNTLDLSETAIPADQFLFLEYEVDDNDKHEAVISEPAVVTDEHDYEDGYIFKLSQPPWLLANNNDNNFTIGLSAQPNATVVDISDYKGPVNFTNNNEKQFYYYNQKLYTNFNMMEVDQTITVTYNSMCSGISLEIELADYAKVNDYTLNLIGTSAPVHGTEPGQFSDSGGLKNNA